MGREGSLDKEADKWADGMVAVEGSMEDRRGESEQQVRHLAVYSHR